MDTINKKDKSGYSLKNKIAKSEGRCFVLVKTEKDKKKKKYGKLYSL